MHTKTLALPSNGSLPLMGTLLLVACAAQQAIKHVDVPRTGDVAMTAVDADDGQTYAVAKDQHWNWPLPLEGNAAPIYPSALLAENLPPVTVRIRVVVNEHGDVVDSVPLDAPANYPQFVAAVQAVAHDWKYSPLVRWTPSETESTQISYGDMTVTYWGPAEALPFHQDYDIVFTQKDGQGVVTTVVPANR
jgi:hypothetical protein